MTFSREEKTPEERGRLRVSGHDELTDTQEDIRAGLKHGKKPTIPPDIETSITENVQRIVASNGDNVLLSVLPEARGRMREYLEKALTIIASELKRSGMLDTSFFSHADRVALMAELLIINADEISFAIEKKQPLSPRLRKDAERIATYHPSDSIDRFLNSDELLCRTLGITAQEALEAFPRSVRLRFAVGNISDPLEALGRVKTHLDTTLTDANIAKKLGITAQEALEALPRSVRLHFAVNNISDPLEALGRVKTHLDTTLTDANIAKKLGITAQEALEAFPRSVRLRFAVSNISDPIEGVRRWIQGEITTPFKKPRFKSV